MYCKVVSFRLDVRLLGLKMLGQGRQVDWRNIVSWMVVDNCVLGVLLDCVLVVRLLGLEMLGQVCQVAVKTSALAQNLPKPLPCSF